MRLHQRCEFIRPPIRGTEAVPDLTARDPPSRPHSSMGLEQRLGYMEKILSHYIGNSNLDVETLRNLAESVDQQQSRPRLLDVQSHSSSCLGVDDENFTVKPLENNITHYSGEFSHWNFSMRIKQWIEQCAPDPDRNGATQDPRIKEYYRPEELQSSSNTLTSLASLPPRYIATYLVEAFFKHAETNYFYVERGWLMGKLNMAYENAQSLSRRDVGTVCMLFIILAIGTQYAYLDSQHDRSGSLSDPHDPSTRPNPFSEDSVGIMFYQQACRLVPDVITIASLESVQACLLIGLYTLPLDASGLSYIYLNLAVKLAIQNGMHRKYTGENLDPVARETRNRVWWTAYTIEKRVGTFHGRPISISSSDVDAEMPIDRPDMWPLNPPLHYPRMMATLYLNQILGTIAHEIFILRAQAKNEMQEGLAKLVEIKAKFLRWWESLPDDICQKDATIHSSVSRPNMHLKLEYCLVRMFAGRSFIFPKESTRSNADVSASPADSAHRSSTSGRSNPRSILVADCVDAALTIIDTCHLLRNTVGLARASYTEFSACRAALLVIITQCLQKKTDRLRNSLRYGMGMIKEMATGGESARAEASLIEAFERAIARLDATEDSTGATPETDYARFKQWEELWKTDSSLQEGGNSSLSASMPLPPQPINFLQGFTNTGRNGTGPVQSAAPTFGADGALYGLPQPADEFASLLEYGFRQDYNALNRGMGNF